MTHRSSLVLKTNKSGGFLVKSLEVPYCFPKNSLNLTLILNK